jgi:hypothetical protein
VNDHEQEQLAELIAREELRVAAWEVLDLRAAVREVLPTVGQMRAERDPTPTQVERERYAGKRTPQQVQMDEAREQAGRKPRKGRA